MASTLIYRAPGTLSQPDPAGFLAPDLGVTDVVARYHAGAYAGVADGGVLATVANLPDPARPGKSFGSVTVGTRGGKKVIKPAGAGYVKSPDAPCGLPRTLAISAWFPNAAAAGTSQSIANTYDVPNQAWGLLYRQSDNNIFGWAAASAPYPARAAGTFGEWKTIVVVFRAGGTGSLYVNGAETEASQNQTVTPTTATLLIRGAGDMNIEFRDAVIVGHSMTDAEVATLTAAMQADLV